MDGDECLAKLLYNKETDTIHAKISKGSLQDLATIEYALCMDAIAKTSDPFQKGRLWNQIDHLKSVICALHVVLEPVSI
jgi:hypothetical protein